MSWIHYEDFVAAVRWLIDRDGIDGIVVPFRPAATLAARIGIALAEAAAPDRRASMAERARYGADRFDVGRRVAEIEALYRDLQPD